MYVNAYSKPDAAPVFMRGVSLTPDLREATRYPTWDAAQEAIRTVQAPHLARPALGDLVTFPHAIG
jgi:hypothetical protein